MKQREWILLVAGLVLIAGSAVALKEFKARQRLGLPGLKCSPIPDSIRLNIQIPTNVPGYQAEPQSVPKIVLATLPADTSIAMVSYKDRVGASVQMTAVLMGTDRTSIHKPQFCLPGAGWKIDDSRSEETTVRIERPRPVDLPVMKLISRMDREENGRTVSYSSLYVYWFVAADGVTAEHLRRVRWMAEHLVRTGELQRWAYISFFSPCLPGQEEEAFDRIKKLMNATVPEFQLAWPAPADSPPAR